MLVGVFIRSNVKQKGEDLEMVWKEMIRYVVFNIANQDGQNEVERY